jgi:hypothetical protein
VLLGISIAVTFSIRITTIGETDHKKSDDPGHLPIAFFFEYLIL